MTTLPSKPAKGDRCQFIADKANGVLWSLIYSGEGSYPWWAVGASPILAASKELRELTNQTAYVSLPTDPLSISLPLKGDYDIQIEGNILPITGGAGGAGGARLSYSVGATAANNEWGVSNQQRGATGNTGDQQISVSKKTRFTALAAAAKIEEKGLTPPGVSAGFIHRRLWVSPVRVG